ncbi:hypothetical protein AB3Z07_28545 (plasmid) [Metabacillus halosaccharovorans]|uniref:hypothetical protein n=1 Tax=Metabacillus halosaccharovorans TaxID=930124 RepID=UPI001C1FBADA|nr:hypothetical protein [Metabacillus halosaccharovorans]MBU7595821.1 hypothetical protein [Metabacillus halosaccharovorans]MCM3441471.1 hypothetical protein [Metabacillus halosaccharovorans]
MTSTFCINARKEERKFMRKVKKFGYLKTVNGHINTLINYDKKELVLKTSKGGVFTIRRKNLRKSIQYLFFIKTAIRKDVEKFSNFSSALFGILCTVFENISKIQKLKNGLLRLTLLGCRHYISGAERDKCILDMVQNLMGNFVLFNYEHIDKSERWLEYISARSLYCIFDSGAFTNMNRKNTNLQLSLLDEDILNDISIEGYASFINKYSDHPRVMGFFQLDVIGDPLKTRENFFKLQKLTKNNPKVFPVWQFEDTLTNLEELVNSEHELIGIGGLVRYMTNRKDQVVKVLDDIFSKFRDTNFHFFGGSNELLLKYPWFSSDSTAHLNARKSANQRKVYLDNGYRIDAPVDMSTTDIIRQNIEFLVGLEKRNCIFQQQEMFLGGHLVG